MRKFRERRDTEGLTQSQLAQRMGKRPDALSRLLARPSNWTLDTLSDFLLAIAGEEIDATSSSPESQTEQSADQIAILKNIRSEAAPAALVNPFNSDYSAAA